MFSVREEAVIKILGKKKMTLEKISMELFKDYKWDEIPFDHGIAVANSVRRIIKKCNYLELKWTLTKKREKNKLYIRRERNAYRTKE